MRPTAPLLASTRPALQIGAFQIGALMSAPLMSAALALGACSELGEELRSTHEICLGQSTARSSDDEVLTEMCSCDPLTGEWVCKPTGGGVAGVEVGGVELMGGAGEEAGAAGGAVDLPPDPTSSRDDLDALAQMNDQGGGAQVGGEMEPSPPPSAAGAEPAWEYASFSHTGDLPCEGVGSYIHYHRAQSAWVGVRVCDDLSGDLSGAGRLRLYMSADKSIFAPIVASPDLAGALCELVCDAGVNSDALWVSDDPAPLAADASCYVASRGERLEPAAGVPAGLSTGLVTCSTSCLPSP